MDLLRKLLEDLKREKLERGHTLGVFHLLIGRRLQTADGTQVSRGMSWRALAALLKKARWPTDCVRELGLDPAKLPPRDRQQYWYVAISLAGIDSPAASQAADALVLLLEPLGYRGT